jgi:nicotinamidase-related amidase
MATALLVIDVQKGMFDMPGMRPFDGEGVVRRIAELIARARKAGMPVIFVQHDGGEADALSPGKPGFALHPMLTPLEGEATVIKRQSSAFHETDLHKRLTELGIDHLIITGMQTEFCIDSTFRGARERGYRLTLVADCHTTFDSNVLPAEKIIAHHNRTLGDGATVVPAGALDI